MPPPQRIAQTLSNSFPKPQVDVEWLEQCCAWVEEDKNLNIATDYDEYYEVVKKQLIESDLCDSMAAGTGLVDISRFSGILQGPPVLVQIIAITDVGVSAFQLEQIRASREERILAGLGDEEGEEDGDVEVEGEGPMPKYPRGTLRLTLSDGHSTFEGMEYKPLPELVLGKTELGYKLQLNKTRFSNGLAMLEPNTVVLVGGRCKELEDQQLENFKRHLAAQLGRPIPPPDEDPGPVHVPNYAPQPERAPLRDISPSAPSRHDDDIDMEPRRRVPVTSSLNQPSTSTLIDENRPVRPLPRKSLGSTPGTYDRESSTSTHFPSSSSSSNTRQSSDLGFNLPPTNRQQAPSLPSPSTVAPKNEAFDFDLFDACENDENAAPPRTSSSDKGKGRANPVPMGNRLQPPKPAPGASSDYEMDDDLEDPDLLDRLEQEALEKDPTAKVTAPATTSHSRAGSIAQTSTKPPASSRGNVVLDVIEIESSEDEDKENSFVPMRHVRQRTVDQAAVASSTLTQRGRSPPASSRSRPPTQTQRRKVAPAVKAEDIIDLSDSD